MNTMLVFFVMKKLQLINQQYGKKLSLTIKQYYAVTAKWN